MGTTTSNTDYSEVLVVSNYDGSAFSGLAESAFSVSYILDGDVYSDPVSSSFSEVGSSGKYIFTVSFPEEGFWLVQVDVSNSIEVVESHFLNIKVKDGSGGTISSKKDGSSLGPVDSLNFVGSGVEVTREGTELTISVVTVSQVPSAPSGESEVPAEVGSASGTLSFASRST